MFIHSWSKMPLKLAWNFVHRHVWRHITRICTRMLSGYWFKSQGDIINCVYKPFSTQSWCHLQRKLMIKAKKRHIGKWDVKRSQKSGTVFRQFPNCLLTDSVEIAKRCQWQCKQWRHCLCRTLLLLFSSRQFYLTHWATWYNYPGRWGGYSDIFMNT